MTMKELNEMKEETLDRLFKDMFPEYEKMRKEVRKYKTRCSSCEKYIMFNSNVCKRTETFINIEPVLIVTATVKCPNCGHYKSVKFEERA